ncbi:MAG: glycosyltransferase family 4 protein [Leptospiraceae bacterium]|nr:glycosyltransferase family 4 protein [Leptospiraceae bacterium]MCP5513117.1 glycosyltransferase family 4 protein [Leptospiraceae bacterium]
MILHLNTAKTWRGGERQCLYLAEGLAKRNIPQILVGQPDSEFEKRTKDRFEFIPLAMRGEWDLKAVSELIQIIKAKKIRLVHTHTARAHAIALFAKYFYPHFILVVSRRVDFTIRKGLFSHLKYTSDLNDVFLTVSGKIKEILIKDGVNPEKIITVYSGIDLDRFERIKRNTKYKKEFDIKGRTVVFGNIAALVDHKDHETLIKAISLVQSKRKVKLLIVGEGELEGHLKSLVKDLKIEDRVIFTGFRDDIPELLKFFDVFAITSKEEGLGTSVLDAMASGLPIIATRGGGLPEMISHEKGGYLSNVKDSVGIFQYINQLAVKPSLRKEFGNYNREAVKRFSIDSTIEKTIQVYSSFLGNKFWETQSNETIDN